MAEQHSRPCSDQSVFQRKLAPHLDSGVDTGSREENASKQEIEPRSDSIGTEKALESNHDPISLFERVFGKIDLLPKHSAGTQEKA